MRQNTNKLVPLNEDEENTRLMTTVYKTPPPKTRGVGTCVYVNNMLRHSGVMLVAHTSYMGDFRVLGVSQSPQDLDWLNVRVWTKTGESSILRPWYDKFDLFLGQP